MAETQGKTTKTPEAVAEEKAAQARESAAEAVRKANEDEQAALAKAAAQAQKKEAGSDLIVLVDGFVARDDKDDKKSTHRYRAGETFEPVDGVHKVERFVKLGYLGKADGKTPLRRATALQLSQKAAEYHQEDSPVIDLHSVPFEQNVPADAVTTAE
jgi:hypothetical protein